MTASADPFDAWDDLLSWLASRPAAERDDALERRFGLTLGDSTSPAVDMIGYHASGLAPLVRAFVEVPVRADDVVIDLGSGLGKVVMLAALLAASARGVEIQASLVENARALAARQQSRAVFVHGDCRDAYLEDGTVFFLYLPFTGAVRAAVLGRLEAVARRHPIVVCALGMDITVSWLRPRPTDAFWLTIYDSAEPRAPRALTAAESAVIDER